jgi:hypothetical protein
MGNHEGQARRGGSYRPTQQVPRTPANALRRRDHRNRRGPFLVPKQHAGTGRARYPFGLNKRNCTLGRPRAVPSTTDPQVGGKTGKNEGEEDGGSRLG